MVPLLTEIGMTVIFFTLNIANSTIDDDYEALYFTDSYLSGDVTKYTNETFDTSEGVAVNLDVESNINISNNSRCWHCSVSREYLQQHLYDGIPYLG